jgi:hypothetical protein
LGYILGEIFQKPPPVTLLISRRFFSLSRDKESFHLIFLLLFGGSQVSTSFQLSSRVTGFGDFSPLGRLFTFSNFLI